MVEMYELLEPADSLEELLESIPSFSDFIESYERIDVGYDCFLADAYVCGAFYIVRDEERYLRDTWGWSACAEYVDRSGKSTRIQTVEGNYKCTSPEEALASLVERLRDLS